jgi:hypothetical protein
MDFYRASNSPSWGAAVEGAVCRGWERVAAESIDLVPGSGKVLVVFEARAIEG